MNNSREASQEEAVASSAIEIAIRIGLIVLLVAWCFNIAAPFITPIAWGIIIAIGTYPVYRWLQTRLGIGKGLAATLFTLLMLFILITPTVVISDALLENARELSENLKDGTLDIPPPPESVAGWPLIGKKVSNFWSQASQDPKGTLGRIKPQLEAAGKWLIKVAAGAGLGILMFVFSIIIAGVFLAKAEGGRNAAVAIFTRLFGERGVAMTDLAHSTVKSVVNGILGIALLQAILAGIGFVAIGLPGAGVLAFVCLVLAVVQIDILLVLIPLSIYAFSFAGTGAAVAFLIWNILVGLMNNVLKPILLGRGVKAPMAIIFIGAIGGMIYQGIIGLFVGAVVFVLGYTLFMVWLEEGKGLAAEQD